MFSEPPPAAACATSTPDGKAMSHLQRSCLRSVYGVCRYQLVYAVGDPQELPSLAERVAAVQAVTRVLCRMVDAGHPAVADERLAVWQPANNRCGQGLLQDCRMCLVVVLTPMVGAATCMAHALC